MIILALLQYLVTAQLVLVTLLCVYGSLASVLRRASKLGPFKPTTLGISVLKPLHGIDPHLADNLESFAALTPGVPFEVLLLLDDEQDEAYPLAQACASAHPGTVRVIIGKTQDFANPKVASLAWGLPHAKHPLIWISDSNTEATNAQVKGLTDAWSLAQVNGRVPTIVHAPLSSVRGSGLGARLERLQLVTYNNSSYEVSLLGNVHAVVGKSLLIHRDDLAEVGGFERFAASGGEDYLMAKAIQAIGTIAYSKVASRQVLAENLSWRSFFERQRRWATLRSHMVPGTFYGLEHFTYFAVALFFSILGVIPFAWVAVAFGVKLVLDGALIWSHTREAPSLVDLAIMPFKEVLLLSAWGFAAFGREVTWRGRLLHLTPTGDYEVERELEAKPVTSRSEHL
jgi:ceramide glucosyltransferase